MKRTCEGCGSAAERSLCAGCLAKRERAKQRQRGTSWPTVREAILARDGHRCRRCGVSCPHPRHHEVNHIEQLAVAPHRRYDPANLETLCRECHLQAGREQRA